MLLLDLDDYSLIRKLYNIYEKFFLKLFFSLNPGIGETNGETVSNIAVGS